jgi:nucleoside-diphosphate-sugar epimerase
MKSVLILGGGGFIGINIARRLMDDGGYELTLADLDFKDRLEEQFPDPRERDRIKTIKGDFSFPEAYAGLAEGYDQIYMMAAVVGVNNTLREPHEVIRINTALVHYLLQWLRTHRAGRLLFASSSENYAGTTDAFDYPVPTDERVPLCIQDIKHPRFTYAVTKILGESAFLNCAAEYGFECSIVRYQNIFGPNMGFKHVIPHLTQRFYSAQADQAFKIYGHDQTRAFCYVTDAVDGTVRAMNSDNARGEIYHIGNTEEITLETLTRTVGEYMGYRGTYEHAETYPGSVRRRCPDITKSRLELGYEPIVDWREGLRKTVEWYVNFYDNGRKSNDPGFEPPDIFKHR